MPSMLIDIGYLSFTWCRVQTRNQLLERLLDAGALLCFDSHYNMRMAKYDWYKANRGASMPAVTHELKAEAKAWQAQIKKLYPEYCLEIEGLEADDVIALELAKNDDVYIMTRDHDFLQLRNAYLVDKNMERWSVTRLTQKTLYLEQGERYLTYQLLHGCSTDTVPRTILSSDRYTAPFVFSQPNPLRVALSMIPEQKARESLDVLLLPTPLYTNTDSIEEALARYP